MFPLEVPPLVLSVVGLVVSVAGESGVLVLSVVGLVVSVAGESGEGVSVVSESIMDIIQSSTFLCLYAPIIPPDRHMCFKSQ